MEQNTALAFQIVGFSLSLRFQLQFSLLRLNVTFHAEGADNSLTGLFLKGFLGYLGNRTSALGNPGVLLHCFRVLFFGNVACGEFCEHIHNQLFVGHVIAQILFLWAS